MQVTRRGAVYNLLGTQPTLNQVVPNFSVTTHTGETLTQDNLKGHVSILSIVPNINTRVCDMQTRTFNQKAASIPNLQLWTIAKNTPEEFSEWCAAANLDITLVCDVDKKFGDAFGLVMDELDVLARSVFVVNPTGQIVYIDIVSEMVDEPNYEAALSVAKQLLEN